MRAVSRRASGSARPSVRGLCVGLQPVAGLVSALYITAWYCNGATAAASVPVFCCAAFAGVPYAGTPERARLQL